MLKKSIAKAGIVMIIGALSSIAALVVSECAKNSAETLSKAEAGSDSENTGRTN